MSENSPTPWIALEQWAGSYDILDADRKLIAVLAQSVTPSKSDAELIVQAVNSQPALLAAAEDFVAKVDSGRAISTDSYSKFKAAIALAKEGG